MNNTIWIKLSELSLPLKILFSFFLITIGIGYIVALFNLFIVYNLTDGKPGLTADDLRRAFYGDRSNTRLAAKINGGSMSQYLPKPGDKEIVLNWIQDGALEDEYIANVKPILERNCIRCHARGGISAFQPLTDYANVMNVVKVDRGEPIGLWARVAHTHIQSIGLIFLALGFIFLLTSYSNKFKIIVISIAYLSLIFDFGSRFAAKYIPGIVYLMLVTGALVGLSIATMILLPLFEIWIRKEKT